MTGPGTHTVGVVRKHVVEQHREEGDSNHNFYGEKFNLCRAVPESGALR